ncbi:MAG: transcriptional regulatory protein RstA [Candidatus Magasanikbacteria bacterium GW2011_GWD2_43_18]|uniref:Transcriptional regulatory protein RstA n=1 Tax=Candidatus Magasanikbacteria bacterium GW2011_GWE2_42_7 TaxID=1619052 RepID=A0A0G1BA02_9BACT|nr:MAG: transcriptional regulatory protein RstA [Candidatus Magasanikbacteria bacterium GW2011_GWC2_42_27]KKS70049.1 MAG: transcriptional regulatory protein RstA [Candidatus Magasanikbacteria bacterium GW2011_GWE2_42_7]KKT04439.1 MAG: transcriptional regulatory protein RstA [Candidatus Magasanikbacteria bacterium GW2011_GWD2_43_18]KKT26050.1 MAG: transcriptional regulatory protein RstA [Candidatus Magasanikbacteria bacterium GW2011_GWA2_43_9]
MNVDIAERVACAIAEACGEQQVLSADPQFVEVVRGVLATFGIVGEYNPDSTLFVGNLRINTQTHVAHLGTRKLILTGSEFRLLHVLAKNAGTVLGRDDIARAMGCPEYIVGSRYSRVVDVYVGQLRKKLGDERGYSPWILTIRGQGYMLVSPLV